MKSIRQLWASRRGYTIDQTILIVAIIAILITLVIVTIGWTLLNRAGGTKTGSQLTQIQPAIAQYYDARKTYPSIMSDLTTDGYIATTTASLAQFSAGTGNNRFVIVSMTMPVAEAIQADMAIDGGTAADGTAGRLRNIGTNSVCTPATGTTDGLPGGSAYGNSGNVTVCFQAQRII